MKQFKKRWNCKNRLLKSNCNCNCNFLKFEPLQLQLQLHFKKSIGITGRYMKM